LFRLIELSEGTVEIDGANIRELGLHIVRKNISFIPQAPFLLQGTIRENLDPFNEKTDEEVKKALEEVQLLDFVMGFKDQL